MPNSEEIERRVQENDSARSAKRTAAAMQVGELAQRRAAIVEQLAEVERELGDVLVDAQDVIGIDELARFTDVAAADLTQWLTARTARRSTHQKRKRPTATADADTDRKPYRARTTPTGESSTPSQSAHTRDGVTDGPARVPAAAT